MSSDTTQDTAAQPEGEEIKPDLTFEELPDAPPKQGFRLSPTGNRRCCCNASSCHHASCVCPLTCLQDTETR